MSSQNNTATLVRPQQKTGAIRSLLVHVEPGAESRARLLAAASLAQKLDATLIGVGAEMIQTAGVTDPFGVLGAEWVVELQKLVVDNLARAEATFRAETAGLKTEWLSLETYPGPAVARLARGADLVIAGGAPPSFTDDFRVAHTAELIVQCGRPVLVVPSEGGRLRGEAVVVAWKDTREARRAVADALPFLQSAEEVMVQAVCAKEVVADTEVQTASVVAYLQRHGVVARARVTVGSADDAVGELLATARLIDADLIVAGGYGHSRMGEWVFGGVTRSLLRQPNHFVLLSH
jgi:nucleotide-binding universal stress UspA family protein